jgi:P27 family predicted phage terminase small subunit
MPAGRPKKSKIVKLHQGTFHPERENPAPPVVTPELQAKRPPAHLNRYGKRFWKEYAPELVDAGILTVVDWAAFELAAANYGIFREMQNRIRELGGLAAYLDGRNSQTSPELTAMHRASSEFLKFAGTLGLSPASRQKLTLEPKKDEAPDPMAEMWEAGQK